MKTFLSLLLCVSATFCLAQEQGKGIINGSVTDSTTQKAVEFATVALLKSGTDKPVDGAVADENGKFSIKQIAQGNYQLAISFIGYETKTLTLAITDKKEEINLGNIRISPTVSVLKELTVEGQKALVEERVDRTIYNAENDVTSKGGDATDVLRKVPMLSVDLDGNVSLRGNQNIQVLINNKPSTIVANNIADALKQIPADQIKTVEVITSPSAKYDAEGSAGIINIITKKNNLEGLTLNINSGVGLRGSNLGLNGNYRRGKLGFSLGGWGRSNYNIVGSFRNEQLSRGVDPVTGAPTESINIQQADTRSSGLFGNYTFGFDYDINDKNFITSSVRFGVRNNRNRQENLFTGQYQNDVLLSGSLSNARNVDQSNNVDANVTFTHLYAQPQHELSFQGQFSRNNRSSNFNNFAADPAFNFRDFRNVNDSYNQEVTVQVDYQKPLNQNQMIELGAKNIVRKVESDFTSFRRQDGTLVETTGENLNNNLNYDQNVMAAYLSYTLTLPKGYSIKAGTRYEYTTIKAYTRTEDNIDIPSYEVLVPSFNASKKLKNGNTVKLSYNRRIQRPSIRFLNPNAQFQNNLNVTIGNPSLDPEFTNNFEVGYSTFIKGITLNLTGFVRNTNNAIQSVRDLINRIPSDPDTIRTTYQNIGMENAYGTSIFANVNIGKFTLNGGGDVYYATLDNNSDNPLYRASNSGIVVSGRVFGSYKLNKGWAVQCFGFGRARDVQLQGTQGAFRMYSIGLQKDFNNKKGSIGFGAENFITGKIRIRNEINTPILEQRSVNTLHNFSVRVNFNYRIGKMNMDNKPRRRRTISNDDLKEGGDGGGMDFNQNTSRNNGGGMGTPAGGIPLRTENKNMVQTDSAAVVNAEGIWEYTIESPQGGAGTLTIAKEGERLTGTIKNNRFPNELPVQNLKLIGNELSFTYEVSFNGNQMLVSVVSTIKDDDLNGMMTVGQFGSFPINAKRKQN